MAMTLRLMIAAALSLATMSSAVVGADGPKIDRAWARATSDAAQSGVAYFTTSSPTADRLIGVASPVAERTELHMQMRAVEGGVAMAAGQVVKLKPGGLHVMLMNLKHPLKEGDSFPLTVTFERAGRRQVTVKIEKAGAMDAMDHTSTDHGAMNHGAMDHGAMHHEGSDHHVENPGS
jgi:periplasmic copper chaperone A